LVISYAVFHGLPPQQPNPAPEYARHGLQVQVERKDHNTLHSGKQTTPGNFVQYEGIGTTVGL